jgi:2-oxoglutarate ferredoxin oxidoreductase subunit gamma
MHQEIIISGFGGQGVLFAGQLLAYAGMAEGRHVTWIPSYGPEMRGGTAHCTVIISDQEIGSPLVEHPTAAVVMNPPSLEKYAPLVRPQGLLVVDATLIEQRAARTDLDELLVPARAIADELGTPQSANVVLLGALSAATGVVTLETLGRVLAEHLSARRRDTLEANLTALRRGAECVWDRVPAQKG